MTEFFKIFFYEGGGEVALTTRLTTFFGFIPCFFFFSHPVLSNFGCHVNFTPPLPLQGGDYF